MNLLKYRFIQNYLLSSSDNFLNILICFANFWLKINMYQLLKIQNQSIIYQMELNMNLELYRGRWSEEHNNLLLLVLTTWTEFSEVL